MVFSSALPSQVSSVFVRFPQSNPTAGRPPRVLVALHGIGGDGATFARDLAAAADQNGWVLVAPTIAYGDWMDPAQVANEDAALIKYASAKRCQQDFRVDRSIRLRLAAAIGQAFQPAELRSVHFWVGVGNNDTNPTDVPRQFDSYLGDDRLDRAQAFVAALRTLEVSAQLAIFPNVPHALTPDMQRAAVGFLADQSASAI
jgi:predicted esterase